MTKKSEKKQALVPKLRFPEFQKDGGWKHVPLGKHADIIKKRAGKKKYPVMSINTGVGLVSQLEKFGRDISGKSYKNYTVIGKDDFAYNKSGTKEFPEGFIAKHTEENKVAVPNSIFTCFRLTSGEIQSEYLYFQLLNNLHGKWLRKFITVGARAHGALSVNSDDLLNLPVPIPSAASSIIEQQKIAGCLESLDDLIAANSAKLDALLDNKKSLLQQLFPSEGQTTPILRFPEFRDAEAWGVKRLKETTDINPANEGLPNSFVYIDLESVKAGELKMKRRIARASAPSRAQRLLDNGDIIYQAVRPYQKNNLLCIFDDQDDYVASTGYAQLRACECNRFLYQAIHTDTFVNRVIAKSTGSNYPAINSSDLAEICLALPQALSEQQKIADFLSTLDDLITAQTEKIATLKEHKKGLMQQLFPNSERSKS